MTLSQNAHQLIRPCRDDEAATVLSIINRAAEVYRGVIPADCWHEPYMSASALHAEAAAGVTFQGCVVNGQLVGVMGMQTVRNVDLVRHAYVLPGHQGAGVGSALIADLRARSARPLLVGTWAAAPWAIRFYQRHGFVLVPPAMKAALLRTYWTVSDRQIETSVVLSVPGLDERAAEALMRAASVRTNDAERSVPAPAGLVAGAGGTLSKLRRPNRP